MSQRQALHAGSCLLVPVGLTRSRAAAHIAALVLAVGGLASQTLAQQDAPASPEPLSYAPPEFFPAGPAGADEYLQHALRVLREEPQAPIAPRAALDVFTVAKTTGKQALQDEMRAKLLFEYPYSPAAGYLVTTFKDANELRTFLLARAKRPEQELSAEFCRQMARAIDMGQRHTQQLLSGDSILLLAALVAHDGGAFGLEHHARQLLSRSESDVTREIAEVFFNAEGSAADKFVALQPLADGERAEDDMAQLFQRYLYRHLEDAERERIDVLSVQARQLLHTRKYRDAIPSLETLMRRAPAPQIAFWKASAEFAAGERDAALATLASAEALPPDAWSPHAAELQRLVLQADEHLRAQAAELHAALEGLRREPTELLEGTFTYQGDELELTGYVGFDATRSELTALFSVAGAPLLGYRTTLEASQVFVRGDAAIHEYRQRGVYPAPQITLQRDPRQEAQMSFNFNASMVNDPTSLAALPRSLADSPALRGETEIRGVLEYSLRRGAFPLPVRQHDGQTVLAWVVPRWHAPQWDQSEIRLNERHQVTAIKMGDLALSQLRYGARGDGLNAPAWPAVPVRTHDKFDGAIMFRMFAVITEAMQANSAAAEVRASNAPSAETADRAADDAR